MPTSNGPGEQAQPPLDWLSERLPPITEEEIRHYQEAAARGEFMDLTDAFAEMAGVSREEWLKRYEVHMAKNHSESGQPS